ncbi:MAG TPA: hypothetical protein VHX14_22160 [Thermoanaerobaculia bacterium]|nr:hypothetical protein [Thermoanaerobaculia bacterium]
MRLAAAVTFTLILFGGFQPFYLRIFAIDRAGEGAVFAELPFQKMPGLKSFLEGVDAHTRPGTRIAIWVPFRQWEGGYGYAYYRASYLLPGKQVVPLLALHEDRVAFSNLAQADYLASFGERIDAPGFGSCWQDEHGMLLKASAPVTPAANPR